MLIVQSPFPSHIAFVALSAQAHIPDVLHPEEDAVASRMFGIKRRGEFRLGRSAARQALHMLGLPNTSAILVGPRREPLWPEGIVGSLAHSHGLAVAAVGKATSLRTIGLDLELRERSFRQDISERVATDQEQAWLHAAGEKEKNQRCIATFSAKESVYKALYPLVQRYFGFQDASLAWSEDGKQFLATLEIDLSEQFPRGATVAGGMRLEGNFLLTWVLLE